MAHVHGMKERVHIGQDIPLEPSDDIPDRLGGTRHLPIEALGERRGRQRCRDRTPAIASVLHVLRDEVEEAGSRLASRVVLEGLEGGFKKGVGWHSRPDEREEW